MKNFIIASLILMLGVGMFIAATPQTDAPTTYETFTGTSGSAHTDTFAKPAIGVCVMNMSATTTDSIDIQFNGKSGKYRIYGTGNVTATLCTPDGMVITSVTETAVSGTPAYQIIAFELQ